MAFAWGLRWNKTAAGRLGEERNAPVWGLRPQEMRLQGRRQRGVVHGQAGLRLADPGSAFVEDALRSVGHAV